MVLPNAFSADGTASERALPLPRGPLREADSSAKGEGEPGKGEGLRKACREFESIFIYQLLQAMRRSIPKDGLFRGKEEEFYRPMLDEQLARSVALGRGLGLGEILYREFTRLQEKSASNGPEASAPAKEKEDEELFAIPAEGFLSSRFGLRSDPITGLNREHQGLDIAAGMGAPVCASRAGRVIFSGERGGYGKLIILDHGDGYTTYYGHNSKLLVEEGKWVEALEPVALSGNSGRTTGPHVHFEVRHRGKPLDPESLIDRRT